NNDIGNYSLVVDFGPRTAELQTFATGTIDAAHDPDTRTLYVATSQLFHFALSAGTADGSAGGTVGMTIYDTNGKLAYNLPANAGETASGSSAFLVPGAYAVQFTADSGGDDAPRTYRLRGKAISDPIGTGLADTTMDPFYTCSDDPRMYCYPG